MPLETRHLYLETPDDELLQMCFVRPSARELVTPLPYFVQMPTTLQLPRPSVLPASVVLASTAAAASTQPAPAPSAQPLATAARASVLLELEQALLRGVALPAAVATLCDGDWQEALGTGRALDALEAGHIARLSRELRSESLAQQLLSHCLPRLLGAEAAGSADQRDMDPLPEPVSGALLELLHSSGLLRLPAAQFDLRVVEPLRASPGLGRRAAAQAALAYVANASGLTR